MRRLLLLGVASALAGSALSQTVNLYAPVRSIKDQGISVRGWGSGTISETDELAYEGTFSIRVSTRNFFQGGILTFAKPVDLSGAYGDRSNLLRILFRVADSSLTLGGGGGGRPGGGLAGATGGEGGGPPGRQGGPPGGLSGVPGGFPGGRGPGAPSTSNAETNLRNIRLILTTADGKKSEAYVPVNTGAGDRGWRSVAVPLQAISGLGESNKQITEIAISGDAVTTFYVGDLKTINDTTPISGDANYRELNLALGDEIELIGRGFGGSSVLKYHWDFDSTDGIQIDAEGQVVKRKFRTPGTFTITLTITDIFGLKTPYKTTLTAKVNP